MAYDKYDDLMNRAIDGFLTPVERVELENYLRKNPEAGKRFERLQKAADILGHVRQAAPPEEIKQEVMAAITAVPARKAWRERVVDKIMDALRPRTVWRYGYVFSFGVICGVLILAVSTGINEQNPVLDPMQAAGTMMTQSKTETQLLDSKSFNFEGVAGALESRASGEYLILDIEISSEAPAVFDISYNQDVLTYAGLWRPEKFTGSMEVQENHLVVSQQGKANYSLLFINKSRTESYLTIDIKSGVASHREKLSAFAFDN